MSDCGTFFMDKIYIKWLLIALQHGDAFVTGISGAYFRVLDSFLMSGKVAVTYVTMEY